MTFSGGMLKINARFDQPIGGQNKFELDAMPLVEPVQLSNRASGVLSQYRMSLSCSTASLLTVARRCPRSCDKLIPAMRVPGAGRLSK